MIRTRTNDRTGAAVGGAVAGLAAGGALAAVAIRRRRRRPAEPSVDPKLVVRRLFEEPWNGDLDVIDELVSPAFVGHDSAEPEPIQGPAGVRARFEKYLIAFPGGAITVDEQIADGETVATRWTGRGTHTGEIATIAPTGRDVTVSGLTISRVEDGLVVEEWTAWDTLGLLVQLGAIAEPARA